ncbi:MAG: Ger(x)C family spore germination protein, partial [Bacillota bacterium]
MHKRLLIGLMTLILALCLSGCWNYRSLDQVNIVVGIAIDFDENTDTFDVIYETANLAAAERRSKITGKITHAPGKTLFAAARDAKRREEDRLFFGGSHVLIISQKLAREEGILPIIEWFLRDGECRESICVAISQEDTASSILEGQEETKGIISIALHDIIKEDKDITGSSTNTQLFQLYNSLYSARKSAILPALHKVKNGEKEVVESNGLAIIKEDRLAGFLSPEQSRYVLMIENKLGGGIFTLSMKDMPGDDISLEIFGSKTKKTFTYEQGKVTVHIETETNVALAENRSHLDSTDKQVIKLIENKAARM